MSIEGLLQTMDRLILTHLALLELAEKKTSILVHNQVDKLNKIVNKETNLMKQVMALDLQRIEDISEFLLEKGYKPNPKITVDDLAKLVVKAEDKKMLKDAQVKLLTTIDELRKLNVLNQQLIEQSLAFIEYSIDIISSPNDEDVVYHHPNDRFNGSGRSGLFDAKG
ncbi:MAG: FlgN protein [Bacilli bacterium]|nr:FlgN protein [Bacilli bacterium]